MAMARLTSSPTNCLFARDSKSLHNTLQQLCLRDLAPRPRAVQALPALASLSYELVEMHYGRFHLPKQTRLSTLRCAALRIREHSAGAGVTATRIQEYKSRTWLKLRAKQTAVAHVSHIREARIELSAFGCFRRNITGPAK